MGAYASRSEDGLLLVRVTETGSEQTLAEVLDTLDAEIADREQILTAEERRVFSDALVEEIADHLRHRMHEVRGRVVQMNAVLRGARRLRGRSSSSSGSRSRTMRARNGRHSPCCGATSTAWAATRAPSSSRSSAGG